MSDFFIYNAVGWGLVFANGAVISFLLWFSSGVIHTQMPSDGTVHKITVISAYKFNGGDVLGGLSDLMMIVMIILNSPALHLSNFVYGTFFVSKPENLLSMDQGCKFCWFYFSQIGCDIFFITIQWLIVGAIIKRLIRLVKESD
jgi:hypothetical protein